MSEHTEIDYLLNIHIAENTMTDLKNIEHSIMLVMGDLQKIFGTSTASKILGDIQKMYLAAQQAWIMWKMAQAAMTPGIGWAEGIMVGIDLGSMAISMGSNLSSLKMSDLS